MRLYGTPPSHFTRKVRVLLQELQVPYEFVQLDKLLEVGEKYFGNNPLHMFPVLEVGKERLIESDLICEYIISNLGKSGPIKSFFPNQSTKVLDQQRLAIINGGMSAGVTLIRAKRSGIENWNAYPYFRQELAAIDSSLRWLEQDEPVRSQSNGSELTMLDIALMCYLQWAEFREFLGPWDNYPSLYKFLLKYEKRPSFANTHPSLSQVTQ